MVNTHGKRMSWGEFWMSQTDSFGALDFIEVELPNGNILSAYITGKVTIEKEDE